METGPEMKMYFLLKMEIFQQAMLVYRRVYMVYINYIFWDSGKSWVVGCGTVDSIPSQTSSNPTDAAPSHMGHMEISWMFVYPHDASYSIHGTSIFTYSSTIKAAAQKHKILTIDFLQHPKHHRTIFLARSFSKKKEVLKNNSSVGEPCLRGLIFRFF